MKLKKFISAFIASLALTLGVTAVNEAKSQVVNAAEKTVTWTATSGGLGSGIGTGTISTGTYSWNYERTLISGDSYTGMSSGCIQLGKSGGIENCTFTTDKIPGTIKSVSVECSSYQGKHNVTITVGETEYLASTPTASWTTVNSKTGTGTSSGLITISFTDGARALYIKSISVIYDVSDNTKNITFDANGGTGTMSIQEVTSGSDTNLNACSFTRLGYDFAGWSTTTNGAVEYSNQGSITISEDTTLYAQWEATALLGEINDIESYMSLGYKFTDAGDDVTTSWQKVTENLDDWSGEYLLVYEGDQTHNTVAWTGVDAAFCGAEASNNDGTIQSKPEGAISLIVETMEGGYSIKVNGGTNSGKYISGESVSNTITFGTTKQLNTITYDNGVLITSNTSVLRYNYASNNLRFRYFKSASYKDQQSVQLYKHECRFSNTDVRIRCAIDNSINDIKEADTYGIKVTAGETTKYYDYAKYDFENDVDGLFYVVIDLGDVLNNIERATVEFTITAYIQIGDEKLESSSSKTFSVASFLVDDKGELVDPSTQNLYDILDSLGCYDE